MQGLVDIRGKNEARDNEISPWSSSEKMSREHEQSVKPAACLINAFGHKVCRMRELEKFLVFEWIVKLGIRHAAGLEPTIKNFINPLQISLASFRRNNNMVDFFSMDVDDVLYTRQFLQLCDRSDADDLEEVRPFKRA